MSIHEHSYGTSREVEASKSRTSTTTATTSDLHTALPLHLDENSYQPTYQHPSKKDINKSKHHELFQTIAGIAGNILEWYDFAVFGYFSDILGSVFFPPDQIGNAALIESFAVFGGAFVMRPIGGIFMGYLGDTYGRKTALEVSIFLMAFPTFAMGCLPSYSHVGAWSYILLIFIRLLQGLSVGGQMMSSLVFTLESHPRSQWGLYGSFVMAAANFGTLLGGVVAYCLRRILNEEQLHSWGWRIPFLSGILVSLCGFYLKYYCDEADAFHGHGGGGADEAKNPLQLAFAKKNRRQLLAACIVPCLYGGGMYLTFVWMAIFMLELIPNPMDQAMGVNSLALFISVCLLFPIAGWLSDKYGRRRIMTIGGLTFGLSAPYFVIAIGDGNPFMAFVYQSIMGVCLSFWGAPMMAWLVEYFDPSARLTSAAVGYNIGMGIAGGGSPALATYMVSRFGYKSPGFLLTGLAAVALFGLWVVAPEPPDLDEKGHAKKPLLSKTSDIA